MRPLFLKLFMMFKMECLVVISALVYGAICLGLTYVASKLGNILQVVVVLKVMEIVVLKVIVIAVLKVMEIVLLKVIEIVV